MKKMISMLTLFFVVSMMQITFAKTKHQAVLYKDPNCGCCIEYAKYLQKNGIAVQSVNSMDMPAIKEKYKSDKAASCHTMRLANYTIEGHVPVKAIHKLLKERPNIIGLSVPGMPINSPGMGPEKKGTLKVMAIQNDGRITLFSVE